VSATIAELQRRAWQTSEDKGFHGLNTTFGDKIALAHSELSEALEAYREQGFLEWIREEDGRRPAGRPRLHSSASEHRLAGASAPARAPRALLEGSAELIVMQPSAWPLASCRWAPRGSGWGLAAMEGW
jgi:hypothetical protein